MVDILFMDKRGRYLEIKLVKTVVITMYTNTKQLSNLYIKLSHPPKSYIAGEPVEEMD
ncbi:hypothetical protein Sjap_022727 [Stephania japonica]|uniref:Uncharacterized protein n=1 Tax=Stephania japonica TaxID=461633 RepID=A0AAP0HV84_9MAGN